MKRIVSKPQDTNMDGSPQERVSAQRGSGGRSTVSVFLDGICQASRGTASRRSDAWGECRRFFPRHSWALCRAPLRWFEIFGLAALLLLAGCATPQAAPPLLTRAYRPRNVFAWGSTLPPQVRRVALLPMACDRDNAEMLVGRDALEPILRAELAKLRRFELAPVSAQKLQARFGYAGWDCEDALPQGLFSWLSGECGCDAVLFARLTTFRAYAPLAVGWRLRLVDVRTSATLWEGDEVFDGAEPAVQAGARHYQLAQLQDGLHCPDPWVIGNSPRQFGQYAAAQLLATLPGR